MPTRARAPKFAVVRTSRLFEEVCGRIRERIASGDLKPGDKLPAERGLAQQFGVSRTVLREALRSLEIAGLVRLQKGAKGGAIILDGGFGLTRSFSDMIALGRITVEDLTEARILVENAIVKLACTRATRKDIEALESDIARVEALTESGEIGDRLDYNIRFYELIAEATHNQTLILISSAFSRILYHVILKIWPMPINDLGPLRRRFLERFRRGDAEGASAILKAHFERLQSHLSRQQKSAQKRQLLASSQFPGPSAPKPRAKARRRDQTVPQPV